MLGFVRHFRKITLSPCKNAAGCGDVAWSRLLGEMGLVRMSREAIPAAAELGLTRNACSYRTGPLGTDISLSCPWARQEW